MIPRAAWSQTKSIQKRNDIPIKGDFYTSIKWPLVIGKFCGFLLIAGNKTSTQSKRYTWHLLCVLFYYSIYVIHISINFFYLYYIFKNGFSINYSNEFLNYFNMLLLKIFLLRLSKKWKVLLTEIEVIERSLPHMKLFRNACNINMIIMVVLYAVGVFEYTLYMPFTIKMMGNCSNSSHDEPSVKLYFISKYPWFYQYLPFNYAAGILFQVLELHMVFLANFVVGLVMIISIYLKKRFDQFNSILNDKQSKSQDNRPTWCELQIHYTRLSRLVMVIDDILNPMVFVTFFANLLYIAQQLYYILNKLTKSNLNTDNCFEKHKYDLETVLFLPISFVFTIIRMMILSFLSAEMHTASREPLNALYVVPSSAYNTGMYRLMKQVYHSKLALTGLKFFHVTRGTFMSMVATLMTYELVLLQI